MLLASGEHFFVGHKFLDVNFRSLVVIKDNHQATSQPRQPPNKGATDRTKNRLSNVHQ
ncbi:hypothetical protein BDE02_13G077800 [Populus trichocarpa]|nr:hypothetical protein BDE02_13G077800 [Populus trichocarpa]